MPAGDRRQPADGGLQRGEQGDVRGLQRHHALCGGALDRRGVPGRRRAAAHLRHARARSRCTCAQRARAGRHPRHGGRGANEVPGKGGQWRRQARRPARRSARRRARVSAPAAGRATVGRRARDLAEAPGALDHHGRTGGGAERARAGRDPWTGVRTAYPRPRAQSRSAPGGGRSPSSLDRHPAGARSTTTGPPRSSMPT